MILPSYINLPALQSTIHRNAQEDQRQQALERLRQQNSPLPREDAVFKFVPFREERVYIPPVNPMK